jgi:hypothetical protein
MNTIESETKSKIKEYNTVCKLLNKIKPRFDKIKAQYCYELQELYSSESYNTYRLNHYEKRHLVISRQVYNLERWKSQLEILNFRSLNIFPHCISDIIYKYLYDAK